MYPVIFLYLVAVPDLSSSQFVCVEELSPEFSV
jgi:hypothetical protein